MPCRAKTSNTRSTSRSGVGASLPANSAGSDLIEERDNCFCRVETATIIRDRNVVRGCRRGVCKKIGQFSLLIRLLQRHVVRLPLGSSLVASCRRGNYRVSLATLIRPVGLTRSANVAPRATRAACVERSLPRSWCRRGDLHHNPTAMKRPHDRTTTAARQHRDRTAAAPQPSMYHA